MVAHHCHSRKKTSRAKRKRLTAKFLRCREDIFFSFFFCHEVILFAVRLFFLPWGYSFCLEVILFAMSHFLFAVRLFILPWGFSFCPEVSLFAARFFFLPWGFPFCPQVTSFPVTVGWATIPLKFCSRVLIFFNMWVFVRTSTNFAHLVSLHYILTKEIVDWPVPKTLDIFVCQTSENKAFKTHHSVTVVRGKEQEHNLISSPVSTLFVRSAEHYDHSNNMGRNKS